MKRQHLKFPSRLLKFHRDENGPTTVEYAIMLALIILASIGAVLNTGNVQQALWIDTGQTLTETFDASLGSN